MHHSALQSESLTVSSCRSRRFSRSNWTNKFDQRTNNTNTEVSEKILIDSSIILILFFSLSNRNEVGLFSSLAYLLGGGSTDSSLYSAKQISFEEQEAIKVATSSIEECHLEQLLQETKFLVLDSLNELLRALISGCQLSRETLKFDQDSSVFCLELLIKIVLQNRDRVTLFWPSVRQQLYTILVNANEKSFFVERTSIGLLRIAARLLRREELASEVRIFISTFSLTVLRF